MVVGRICGNSYVVPSEEDRIIAHYKALKRRVNGGDMSVNVWMPLARKWHRPVREIKNIVQYHGRTDWGVPFPKEEREAIALRLRQIANEVRRGK